RRQSAGDPHLLDGLRGLHMRTGVRAGLTTPGDVLRPRNVGRHLPARGNTAGSERGTRADTHTGHPNAQTRNAHHLRPQRGHRHRLTRFPPAPDPHRLAAPCRVASSHLAWVARCGEDSGVRDGPPEGKRVTERLHRLLTPLLVTVLAAGLGWVARPTPPRLGPHTTGDTTLAELVRAGLPDPTGHRGLAVAVIDGDTVQFAGLGDRGDGHAVDEHTPFEIGSVGKALTGMLLADLAEEGIVDPEEPLR